MRFTIPLRSLRLAITVLALPILAGCPGEDPTPTPDGGTSTQSVYAITTQVRASDDSQSYIIVTDSVDHTAPLSLDNATEVPGRALGVGIPKSGSLFVAGSEGPTVTRYNLTSDGRLEKGTSVSFANQGVLSIGEYQHQFQFISETKAYYFDGRNSKVIVWNPSDMSVTGAINLTGLAVNGAIQTFATLPIRRENQVIMPLGWRTTETGDIVTKVGLIVVDTTNDTAKVITKDERCGYVRDGVLGPDGMLYLATEVYGSAVRRVKGATAPPPCLLRFNPQTLEFDSSFFVELEKLVNGGTAGSLLPGPNGTVYLRVFDEKSFEVKDSTVPRALASAPAWTWWQIQLGDSPTATPAVGLPASSGSTFLFEANGRTLFTEFATDSSSTSLRELTDQSGKVTATYSGVSFSFVQLR
ncbi:hypothetical protein JQX13_35835 [Archangium violaceum]|uniref:hypothetical protein n=1 Tax=Archangium violaceum TaxID=83451 RepID=UPI00193C855B|nr:hypothetical protein [Archangium violaceum]QRK05503.1 hypothetical protein JQX13_35835 [Archangium violaceum]